MLRTQSSRRQSWNLHIARVFVLRVWFIFMAPVFDVVMHPKVFLENLLGMLLRLLRYI